MIRPTLAVFAIVAIAAMMGAASVAPAYAAKLLVNETTVSEMGPYPYPAEICGVKPVILFQTTVTKVHMWDTGKVKLHEETFITFEDMDGKIIGQGSGVLNEITNVDKLPLEISRDNGKLKCTNGESDPEFEYNNHFGHKTTVNKDGSLSYRTNGS